jgi:hypothetical protein
MITLSFYFECLCKVLIHSPLVKILLVKLAIMINIEKNTIVYNVRIIYLVIYNQKSDQSLLADWPAGFDGK